MDGHTFGVGVVGTVITVAGGLLFFKQHSQLVQLALLPTTIAEAKRRLQRQREVSKYSAGASALLDDSVDVIVAGEVVQHGDKFVSVETSSQSQTKGDKVAAVSATIKCTTDYVTGQGSRPSTSSKQEWTTFDVKDSTGVLVCPQHSFSNCNQIPKNDVVLEHWESNQGWFGDVEITKIASLKHRLARTDNKDSSGYDVKEETLRFGAPVTLYGRVRLLEDDTTLVAERPFTLTQDSRGLVFSLRNLQLTRLKWASVVLMAGGAACIGYAVWCYRRANRRQRRQRNQRRAHIRAYNENLERRDVDLGEEEELFMDDNENSGMTDTESQMSEDEQEIQARRPRRSRSRNRNHGTHCRVTQQQNRYGRSSNQRHPASRRSHIPEIPVATVPGGASGGHFNLVAGGGATRSRSVKQLGHKSKEVADNLCVVCLTEIKNAVLIPCGHQSLCHNCALKWLMSSPNRECPICRQRVVRVQKVFKT